MIILGSNGMLGGMVRSHFREMPFAHPWDIPSYILRIEPNSRAKIHNQLDVFTPGDATYIVNCIGAIKPRFNDKSKLATNIFVNSVFPHLLADWGQEKGVKVIHITTDCVFDGLDGAYTETSQHNALDVYGKSKSLGEPENCMVLRTSIIGPEWKGNKRSLVEWFLSNQGGKIKGFTNHLWNGVTTLELSKCIDKIIRQELYAHGTYHIFSEDINKYELLRTMNNEWDLGIEIEPVQAKQYCNRTMRTEKSLTSALQVASQSQMARELKRYINMER